MERLNGLIEKFEAAIKAHDAKVAAAKAALEERELLARMECMDESFAPPCSTQGQHRRKLDDNHKPYPKVGPEPPSGK